MSQQIKNGVSKVTSEVADLSNQVETQVEHIFRVKKGPWGYVIVIGGGAIVLLLLLWFIFNQIGVNVSIKKAEAPGKAEVQQAMTNVGTIGQSKEDIQKAISETVTKQMAGLPEMIKQVIAEHDQEVARRTQIRQVGVQQHQQVQAQIDISKTADAATLVKGVSGQIGVPESAFSVAPNNSLSTDLETFRKINIRIFQSSDFEKQLATERQINASLQAESDKYDQRLRELSDKISQLVDAQTKLMAQFADRDKAQQDAYAQAKVGYEKQIKALEDEVHKVNGLKAKLKQIFTQRLPEIALGAVIGYVAHRP